MKKETLVICIGALFVLQIIVGILYVEQNTKVLNSGCIDGYQLTISA